MEGSLRGKLEMYLAVKAACDAKPAVWRRSPAFVEAFTDFCACIENIMRALPDRGDNNSMPADLTQELQVAETILTTQMDELIEPFEPVDVAFVDDYTAARSMDTEEILLAWPGKVFPAP